MTPKKFLLVGLFPLWAVLYLLFLVVGFPFAFFFYRVRPTPVRRKAVKCEDMEDDGAPVKENFVPCSKAEDLPDRLPPYFREPTTLTQVLAVGLMFLTAPFFILTMWFVMLFLGTDLNAEWRRRFVFLRLWIWRTFPKQTKCRPGVLYTFARKAVFFTMIPETFYFMGITVDEPKIYPEARGFAHELMIVDDMSKAGYYSRENPTYVLWNSVVTGDFEEVKKMLLSDQKRGFFFNYGVAAVPRSDDLSIICDGRNKANGVNAIHRLMGQEVIQNRLKNMRAELHDIIHHWLTEVREHPNPREFRVCDSETGILAPLNCACLHKLMFGQTLKDRKEIMPSTNLRSMKYLLSTVLGFADWPVLFWASRHRNAYFEAWEAMVWPTAEFKKMAEDMKELGYPPEESIGMLSEAFATAAAAGPLVLIGKTMDQIRSTRGHANLYRRSPEKYIRETARLEPPVTVIPVLLRVDTERVIHGKKVTLPAGTCLSLSMRLANRDPKAFPNPEEFSIDRDFSKLTTWGGVGGTGPRSCPAEKWAISMITCILDQYVDILYPEQK